MRINSVLKGLLAASVVAVLAVPLIVQAQSGAQGASGATTQSTDPQSANTQSSTTQSSNTQSANTQSANTQSGSSQSGDTSAGTSGKASRADQKIVTNLAQGNMAEIELAKMALGKTQNDQVKTYAQQMLDDHNKALGDIQQLAQSKGVNLPTEVDAQHKAQAAKLGALSGDAFDRAYMQQAGVRAHKQMHSMLMSAQSKAKDPDIKALAARVSPTVDQHLNAAQQTSTAMGSSKTKGETGAGK